LSRTGSSSGAIATAAAVSTAARVRSSGRRAATSRLARTSPARPGPATNATATPHGRRARPANNTPARGGVGGEVPAPRTGQGGGECPAVQRDALAPRLPTGPVDLQVDQAGVEQ